MPGTGGKSRGGVTKTPSSSPRRRQQSKSPTASGSGVQKAASPAVPGRGSRASKSPSWTPRRSGKSLSPATERQIQRLFDESELAERPGSASPGPSEAQKEQADFNYPGTFEDSFPSNDSEAAYGNTLYLRTFSRSPQAETPELNQPQGPYYNLRAEPPQPEPQAQAEDAQVAQLDQQAAQLDQQAATADDDEEQYDFVLGTDVVMSVYGDNVKFESTLCRQLADKPALRSITQRRQTQRVNSARRSNVEAMLAHVTGTVAPEPCASCRKGHGPWTECIVSQGQLLGSCANCWFNASGSRCTFHENNQARQAGNNQPQAPPAAAAPGAVPAGTQANYNQQQPMVMAPQQPRRLASRATTPQALVPSHQGTPVPPGNGVDASFINSHEFSQYMANTVRQAIEHSAGGPVFLSHGNRLKARLDATAQELVMLATEYNEWVGSPEGVAEQQVVQNVMAQRQRQRRNASRNASSSPRNQYGDQQAVDPRAE